jgi:hypothetical protein
MGLKTIVLIIPLRWENASPKEPGYFMEKAAVVRTILMMDIVAMALLALFYLRQRRLTWFEYCCWGFLALLVPVLGPFLLISNRPGEWDPKFSFQNDFDRLVSWARRLLPEPLPTKKLGRLEKARLRRQRKRQL